MARDGPTGSCDPYDPARTRTDWIEYLEKDEGGVMRLESLVAWLAITTAATTAAAQEAPLPARAPTPPPARLEPTRVTPYHQSFQMIMVQNGQQQRVGSLKDRVAIDPDRDGGAAVIV